MFASCMEAPVEYRLELPNYMCSQSTGPRVVSSNIQVERGGEEVEGCVHYEQA
jgi:hypothetical protein